MKRPARLDGDELDAAYKPVVRLWILRALVNCNAMDSLIDDHMFGNVTVARFLGFKESSISKYSPTAASRELLRMHAAAERLGATMPTQTHIANNIARLGNSLGLGPVAADLLHFLVVHRNHPELHAALEMIGSLTLSGVVTVLSQCLGHRPADIKAELSDDGKLTRSALVAVDRGSNYNFKNKIDMIEDMADELCFDHEDLMSVFRSHIVRTTASRLTLGDYSHLKANVEIVQAYLRQVCERGATGANVLVYGPPGTGKTEFVRAVAHAAGLDLYEIPTEDSRGKPRAGKNRFEGYRFAQSLLGGAAGKSLLFDEVEDVFCDSKARDDGANASGLKGWVNRLLETNRVPTFWVTNHLESIDRAYRRRFDIVVRLDVPPRSVRKRILDRHTEPLLLEEGWRQDAAAHAALVPAVIERAVKVSAIVCGALPTLGAEAVVTRVMNNTLDALGAERLRPSGGQQVGEYRLDLLNTDWDMAKLLDGLRRVGEARICLYGPPGTGKTAFGRHVADALERPLLVKRASDILSPYVGEAERNIAAMFEEADQEGAVLLLDEADSLLRDRKDAQRSWEVTRVNEMLTQMEGFRGIFVASTNLMGSLDEASLRRFDVRVRFDYAKPEQVVEMFRALCAAAGFTADAETCQRAAELLHLSPGDFAAIARGMRLEPAHGAADVLLRLSRAKANADDPPRRRIGFFS